MVERCGELPVYTIQPRDGGRKRTVHRNLLLPVEKRQQQEIVGAEPGLVRQRAPGQLQRRCRKLPQVPPRPIRCNNIDEAVPESEGDADFPIIITVQEETPEVEKSLNPCAEEFQPSHHQDDNIGLSAEPEGHTVSVSQGSEQHKDRQVKTTRSGRVSKPPECFLTDLLAHR